MVAGRLSAQLGYQVPVLAQVPLDIALREGADQGTPVVAMHPDSPSSQAINEVAQALTKRTRSLAGRNLGVKPL